MLRPAPRMVYGRYSPHLEPQRGAAAHVGFLLSLDDDHLYKYHIHVIHTTTKSAACRGIAATHSRQFIYIYPHIHTEHSPRSWGLLHTLVHVHMSATLPFSPRNFIPSSLFKSANTRVESLFHLFYSFAQYIYLYIISTILLCPALAVFFALTLACITCANLHVRSAIIAVVV